METARRPPPSMTSNSIMSEFVTVVSVGASVAPGGASHQQEVQPLKAPQLDPSGFVTVLKIGDVPPKTVNHPQMSPTNSYAEGHTTSEDYLVEQVLVYRLPGERLGFGLKFEGGTKAAEFVKRLFIQSCAPDSPASRVRGTWGVLTEGDEVLAIDSVNVTSMTRIDCVRCLKDSNVVINLQVRHKLPATSGEDGKSEAPLVISAEKKRTPPPPPPVPPRKGPRKKDLHAPQPPKGFADSDQALLVPTPQTRTIHGGVIHPPDAEVYMDLFSPEHLREQESYCHSESDDTGSSISTVVDRFGSFPTTTTSSFAGSMPSTPTAVQRRIQHINPFDVEHSADEELLFERLVSLQAKENQVTLQPPANFQDAPLSYADEDVRNLEAAILPNSSTEKIKSRKRPPPPPPPRTKHLNQNDGKHELQNGISDEKVIDVYYKEEDKLKETNNNDYNREDENAKMLPRLVDFVPKSTKSENDTETDSKGEASKMFIEQEQLRHTDSFFLRNTDDVEDVEDDGKWDVEEEEEQDSYAFGWCSGQPLATIGEADNEDESLTLQDIDVNIDTPSSVNGHAPLSPNNPDDGEEVDDDDEDDEQRICEVDQLDVVDGTLVNDNVDVLERNDETEIKSQAHQKTPEPAPRKLKSLPLETDAEEPETASHEKMDTRQPPDGHEFPDYHQESSLSKLPTTPTTPPPAMIPRRLRETPVVGIGIMPRGKEQPKTNVKNMIAMFSHNEEAMQPTQPSLQAQTLATINGGINSNIKPEKMSMKSSFDYNSSPMTRGSMSDLTSDSLQASSPRESSNLHKRSQSLVDISSTNDRWTQILDQRRKGISKLKGLIIPEHPDIVQDSTPTTIDLPEIKSLVDTPLEFRPSQILTTHPVESRVHHTRNNSTPSLNITSSPLWSTDVSEVDCAKYSPAFKRKTLQVYSTKVSSKEAASSSDEDYRLPSADAPKSLESITSPTRSDCSFDYASMGSLGSSSSPLTNTTTSKTTKSEDESDNDSAVSSSQSSYISRQSPPASPNHLYDSRMLKPQSVEAINRKNILASAKCRSGKDLNGSPRLIQRKFDEAEAQMNSNKPEEIPKVAIETVIVDRITTTTTKMQNGDTEEIPSNIKREPIEIKETRMIKPPRVSKLSSDVKPLLKTDLDRLTSKFLSSRNNAKAASVTDLRKNFEKSSSIPAPSVIMTSTVKKTTARGRHSISSITATSITATNAVRPVPSKRNSLPAISSDVKVDTKEIVNTAVKSWEDESVLPGDVNVIALRPEIPGGSIGITLAGGTDYETKDITIHKVRNGSVAQLDGRLYKGERVLAINGKSMNGITHAESMAILKEPVTEVIIVTSPPRGNTNPPTQKTRNSSSSLIFEAPPSPVITSNATTKLDSSVKPNTLGKSEVASDKPIITVKLVKDPLSTASGLGFSMEGGRGSPQGDVPLLIKKLFTGGLADKSGMLAVGDELVEIQGTDVTGMPRIDAWSLMKKLPPGQVTLKVRR